MDGDLAVLIGLVVVIPVGLLVAALYRRLNRADNRSRRTAFLAETGWSPAPVNDWAFASVRSGFPTAMVEDVITVGAFEGREFAVVDCTHHQDEIAGHPEGTTLHYPMKLHLVLLQLPVALPSIVVAHHNWISRGLTATRKTGVAPFDKQFQVVSGDGGFASTVLSPYLIHWMLNNPGLQWRIVGNALVGWHQDRWYPPETVALVTALGGIADSIPPDVQARYGQPAPSTAGLPPALPGIAS
ncbi:hypothetical protein E1263_21365 [Kribbella antibiotica]|uniref:Uncharacterized protein n=1 Tax=Kribbella antibiotica TaxID=190195 RepID=A0A4R4ZJH6_9ACTN|nr:hypothetical protein [Kribbella antibiotica]TDD57924.1 hypothetical protein E1263_21365 [Kribbella antibiotica]